MAGWTGLEPAASGVTGRRYNQLNYRPKHGKVSSAYPLVRRLMKGVFAAVKPEARQPGEMERPPAG